MIITIKNYRTHLLNIAAKTSNHELAYFAKSASLDQLKIAFAAKIHID